MFFICLVLSAQAYLGHPEIVYFSCFWASQVAHLPGSTWTKYQSGKDGNLSMQIGTCGINYNFGEPINPTSIPVVVTYDEAIAITIYEHKMAIYNL